MHGVRRFSADNYIVFKWTIGRTDQAPKLNSLLQICNIRLQYDAYKHTHSSQILHSESRTSNLVAVLENDYVNPFDISLDRNMFTIVKIMHKGQFIRVIVIFLLYIYF